MYTITPGEGDLTLVIENIRTGKKIEVPRASRAKMSDDCKTVIATIKPLFSQTRAAKIKKAKKDDMPKDTLAIIDVLSGNIEKIANFKSYTCPDKFLNIFAFEMNQPKEKSDKKEKAAKELYLKNIATGTIDTVKNVASYKFNKDGNLMAYTLEVDKKDSIAKPALMLYNLDTKESKEVISGPKGSKIKLPEFSKVNTLAFFDYTSVIRTKFFLASAALFAGAYFFALQMDLPIFLCVTSLARRSLPMYPGIRSPQRNIERPMNVRKTVCEREVPEKSQLPAAPSIRNIPDAVIVPNIFFIFQSSRKVFSFCDYILHFSQSKKTYLYVT